MDHNTPTTADAIADQAHRNVRARWAWCVHATVFVGVHLLVALRRPDAPLWISTGWSIALALHGLRTLLQGQLGTMRRQWEANERARLTART